MVRLGRRVHALHAEAWQPPGMCVPRDHARIRASSRVGSPPMHLLARRPGAATICCAQELDKTHIRCSLYCYSIVLSTYCTSGQPGRSNKVGLKLAPDVVQKHARRQQSYLGKVVDTRTYVTSSLQYSTHALEVVALAAERRRRVNTTTSE
jgi:hypothetical protein